jgi:hypothetical protein
MIRLTRLPKIRVSNRLALFAAFLLVVSTLAGVSQSSSLDMDAGALAATAATEQAPAERALTFEATPKKKSKGFKVSLLLLRLR